MARKLYSKCVICKRQLKFKPSRKLGMGKTCARKNPGRAAEQRGQLNLFTEAKKRRRK